MSDDPTALSNSIPSSEPTEVEQADPLVGTEIGRYSILAKVAKGGTATVYRALDTVLNREVAVKILHEHLEGKTEVVQRFKNEAKLIAQIRHPNIVNVFDFLEVQGRAVLVVEFMPGITLSALIKAVKKVPEDIVLMICLEILNGLRAAHQKGITHRDIKPANILINSELGVKISDFGLAKLVNLEDGLTKSGVFVGTPSFSSPEQIEGKPLDQRTDIFSLGLTVYLLATRHHAFKNQGDSNTTVWFKIVKGSFQAAREHNPDLSPELERIVNKSLEVNLARRYQSTDEMINDVSALLKSRGLLHYQEALKAYLRNPQDLKMARKYGKFYFQKKFRRLAYGIGAVLVLAGAGFGFWQYSESKKSSQVENPEVPTFNPRATPEAAVLPTAAPSPTPIVATPTPQPTVIATPEPQKKTSTRPKPTKKPEAEIPKPIPDPELFQTSVPVAPNSIVILSPGDPGPGFRIEWQGSPKYALAKDSSFAKILQEGESRQLKLDLKSLDPGTYYWRGGSTTGQVDVESFESYRSRLRPVKRPLIVSSQYGDDVDLELNPWLQDLNLSWQNGPEASAYRLEVSDDPSFKNFLFSGSVSTKSSAIERTWDQSKAIFWRVAYLDESRNVFLMDPVRKINLKVKGSAPYYDVVDPQPGDSATDSVFVKAIGPRGSFRCASSADSLSAWVDLKQQGSFFTGKLNLRPKTRWLICQAKDSKDSYYFTIPLR